MIFVCIHVYICRQTSRAETDRQRKTFPLKKISKGARIVLSLSSTLVVYICGPSTSLCRRPRQWETLLRCCFLIKPRVIYHRRHGLLGSWRNADNKSQQNLFTSGQHVPTMKKGHEIEKGHEQTSQELRKLPCTCPSCPSCGISLQR